MSTKRKLTDSALINSKKLQTGIPGAQPGAQPGAPPVAPPQGPPQGPPFLPPSRFEEPPCFLP